MTNSGRYGTRAIPKVFLFFCLAALGGCARLVVLNPSGDVAMRQRDLLVESTLLMLVIILPVLVLIALFAWKFRAGNKDQKYEPDWDHSIHLELAIWGAPLVIVICLGALTWLGTHLLDPYRPLDRMSRANAAGESQVKPLEVDVVSLDWKWLFFYPEYGIATVNELAAPVDRPIDFRLTSNSVMNSFYVPALAGQIYAMRGMETRLHAVINKPGKYQGISAHYSGSGFSDMNFFFLGLDDAGFDQWVAKVRAADKTLDTPTYVTLAGPSENPGVIYYKAADPKLFREIVTMCVDHDPACMSSMTEMNPRMAPVTSDRPVGDMHVGHDGMKGGEAR